MEQGGVRSSAVGRTGSGNYTGGITTIGSVTAATIVLLSTV